MSVPQSASRRRHLTPGELHQALEALAARTPLPQIAGTLHVTRHTLAQALVEAAWEHWCQQHQIHPMPPLPISP